MIATGTITGTTANYNCVYNNTTNYTSISAGANDVNSDPLFVGGGDYSLQSTSPCIDAGTSSNAPSRDIIGTTRPRGNGYDIGCYEYIPPAEEEVVPTTIDITGNVVDAETGGSLTGAEIKIYNENGTLADSAATASSYTLTVTKNNSYYIRVEKQLYIFPSTKKAKVTDGDHGEVFSAGTSNITMNLYMDSGYPLEITKKANKKKAVIGDIITYDIKITNKSTLEQTNVNILDEITNGFKYITSSSYLDSTNISDPVINSPATFNIGTVNGSETVHLSYQVRVSTGIQPGEYKTTAIAKHATKGWDLSNRTTYNVEIAQNALFDKGTILGKVFSDVNKNGVQEKQEQGIPGVRIATEYGVVVTTDKDGKFHIPNVPEGTHLLKVDTSSFKCTTDNPYVIKMTKGLLAKVSFGVTQATDYTDYTDTDTDNIKIIALKVTEEAGKVKIGIVTEKPDMPVQLAIDDQIEEDIITDKNGLYSYEIVLPGGEHKITAATEIAKGEQITETKIITTKENYFFLVALGEGILKNLSTSGNIEMATAGSSDWFEKGLRLSGKGAFYLRAKVKGKYLITISADTQRSKRKELFTNLDPDKYYPIYGDASNIDYSANDTQDEGYLLIEWDRSYAKWGAFQTEFDDAQADLAVYRRTLQGGNIVYESVGKTKFGDPWTKIKAFYAKAMQLGAHDEFIGTGGSLYYLRHNDVIEGSEKIKVELRDKTSNIIINEYELQEETDYQIDYDQGRIILTKPLGITSYAYNTSIISNDIMDGPRVYLIADYEYRPEESMRKQA